MNALTNGDRLAIAPVLKGYKLASGATNYIEVLKIPMTDRLIGLVGTLGYEAVYKNLVGAITVSMESLNISKPMTEGQILDLADEILDTAGEDSLSLEDVLLFLQKLVRGEFGETYSRMDIPSFMKMFERHRQQRYKALKDYDYEQEVKFKSLGGGRSGDMELRGDEDAQSMLDLMQTFYDNKDKPVD